MEDNRDIVDYLESKGAIEILAEIGEESACRHFHLRHRINLSSSTLSNRLKEGVQSGLLEQTLMTTPDGQKEKGYKLTEKGKKIFEMIEGTELSEMYRERKRLEDSISKQESDLLNTIQKHVSN